MSLRRSYTLIAPFYDVVVRRPLESARVESLSRLPTEPAKVLIDGIGTGLDLPLLPPAHGYVGVDLTRAMLDRARLRARGLDLLLVEGDSLRLPFADASFDHAILHLIVAVVPDAVRCLSEAARVVKRGGTLLVFDKFLRRGHGAWLRRAINPVARRIATRTDVVFEELLDKLPQLQLAEDRGVLFGGWFRRIRLVRI